MNHPEFFVRMQHVTKATRCSPEFMLSIKCPFCGTVTQVGHLRWQTRQCDGCKKTFHKLDWKVPGPVKKRQVNDYFLRVVLPTCRPLLGDLYISDQHMWEAFLMRLVEEGKLQESVKFKWLDKRPKVAK